MNKIYCPVPFYSIELNPEGYRLCCVSQKEYPYENNNYIDFWSGQLLQSKRKQILDHNALDECNFCYINENNFGQSKRLNHLNQKFFYKTPTPFPIHLQFKLSNICNLKCIICSPTFSTKWNEDVEAFSSLTGLKKSKTQYFNKKSIKNILEKFINTDSKSFKTLELYGGEPMLAKSFWQYIESVDAEKLRKVKLQLVSNGTYIKDYHLHALEKFRFVTFVLSVDGTEEIFEFVRYPAKWHIVEDNIKLMDKFFKRKDKSFQFTLSFTLSSFSAIGLKDFLLYCRKNNFPYYINVAVNDGNHPATLLDNLKEIILDDVKSLLPDRWLPIVKNAFNTEIDIEKKEKLIAYYDLIKKQRGKDFIALVKKMYGINLC